MSVILQLKYNQVPPEAAMSSEFIPNCGEPLVYDNKFKVGNGVSCWQSLPEQPFPLKGEVPPNVDFKYVETVSDPLCGGMRELPNIDVSSIINTIE